MNAASSPKTTRAPREFQRVPYDSFQSYREKLPTMTNAALAESIGYSGTVITQWERDGQVPKTAMLAMETLVRRMGQKAELTPKILLLKFRDKDSFALFELMADKVTGMEVLYTSTDVKGA